MLKRIIERYLRASSEREYEIPFRQLLWSLGYELLESHTTHHPFEFGKDIRAIHADKIPKVRLFQTKSGDISQSDWNEMERQLKLMLVMPINHPNVKPDDPIQAIWVCTGDLTPSVAPIMTKFNEEYEKQGHFPVEVWNINTLVDLFESQFFNVNICPDEIVLDVISLLASFNNSRFDSNKLEDILSKMINDDLKLQKPRKIQQALATAEIIVYYVIGRAYDIGDPYSAIETLEIAILYMWQAGRRFDFQYNILESIQGFKFLLVGVIDDLLEDVHDLIQKEHGLFLGKDGLAAVMLYPHRTFELLGYIGFRAWIADIEGDKERFDKCVDDIENIINNNPAACHPIWERAQEDILLTAFILWKAGKIQLASKWLRETAKWVAEIYTNHGGLVRPSAPSIEVIKQLLGIHLSFTEVQPINTSYLCLTILELCYWFNLPDVYETFWEQTKSVRCIEFQFDSEESIYEDELTGIRNQVIPPNKWSEFTTWYYDRYYLNDPTFFRQSIDNHLANNLWILLVVASRFGNRPFPFMFRQQVLNGQSQDT